MNPAVLRLTLASLVATAVLAAGESDPPPDWPVWRGPFGNGSAVEHPGRIHPDPARWRAGWKGDAQIAATTGGCSSLFASGGMIFYRGPDKGYAGTIEAVRADPEDFRHLGFHRPEHHAAAHTPAMAGGLIFLRGLHRVHCIDLRAD